MKKQRTDAAAVNKLIKQLDIDELKGNITLQVLNTLVQAYNQSDDTTQAFIPIMNAAIQAAIDALEKEDGGCGGDNGILSIVTTPLCSLEDFLSHGLGELLGPIIHFVFIVIIIALLLFVCVKGTECLIHGCASGGSVFSGGGTQHVVITPQSLAVPGVPLQQMSSTNHVLANAPHTGSTPDAEPLVSPKPSPSTNSWFSTRRPNTDNL